MEFNKYVGYVVQFYSQSKCVCRYTKKIEFVFRSLLQLFSNNYMGIYENKITITTTGLLNIIEMFN